MMKYMKSIMDVLVSCLLARREQAIIVLFTRSDECRGGAAILIKRIFICVLLICTAEAIGEKGGGEMR